MTERLIFLQTKVIISLMRLLWEKRRKLEQECVRSVFFLLHIWGRESERRGEIEKGENESGLRPRPADAGNEKPAVVKWREGDGKACGNRRWAWIPVASLGLAQKQHTPTPFSA